MTGPMDDALAKKLGLKPGMRAQITDAPPGYLQRLGLALAGDSEPAFLQTFVRSLEQLRHSAPLLLRNENATVWVTYPKKSSSVDSDLSRDAVRDVIGPLGWVAVTIVSIDDTWSALRFRPRAMVKTTRDR